MDPATQAIVKQLQKENTATKAEARGARGDGDQGGGRAKGGLKRHGRREHSFAPLIIIIHY